MSYYKHLLSHRDQARFREIGSRLYPHRILCIEDGEIVGRYIKSKPFSKLNGGSDCARRILKPTRYWESKTHEGKPDHNGSRSNNNHVSFRYLFGDVLLTREEAYKRLEQMVSPGYIHFLGSSLVNEISDEEYEGLMEFFEGDR